MLKGEQKLFSELFQFFPYNDKMKPKKEGFPLNILIVEDETALAEAVEHILRKAGHSVDRVADGQSALDYIRVGGYDLILLDIMLPRLDGISVLRQLLGAFAE